MKGKDEGEGGESLLTTGKVSDLLPGLLWWTDTEGDALAERIERIEELKLSITTQGDHLIHLLKSQGDGAESSHEHIESLSSEVFILVTDLGSFGIDSLKLGQTNPIERGREKKLY